MNADLARLRRWLRRAQPPRQQLTRALVTGFIASATNVALLVGAIALLVESSTRPGLRAVAIVLVVIELFAFLRSPLRFSERLAAHKLGYAAVTRWRRWLVLVVGQLNYSQWRTYASGDLLERALSDTDELQDLWLRFAIPFVDVLAVMIASDVVVASLPPHGHWWTYAVNLAVLQVIGVGGLCFLARGELVRDRELRRTRGLYRAALVELSAATPEITLLGRATLVETRSEMATTAVTSAERSLHRYRRSSNVIVAVVSLLALVGVVSHPATSSVWLVVATMIGLTNFELLSSIRSSLQAAVEVSGGGERLEALAATTHAGTLAWPDDTTLQVEHLTLDEDGRTLVRDADLTVEPGLRMALVGESGVGKSTFLRALSRLDPATSGTVSVGGVPISDIAEDEFRRHLTYVASEPGLTRGYAVDVVALGRRTERDPHRDLATLGVESDRTTRFEELSRGERVRVALARALVTSPSIYVLDEPTAGLGRNETARVLDLLGTTGATVIVATHDRDVIEWCDIVVELRAGELLRVTR
jgi:ABC-type transport system involved in cytochrome bd biosynthesis fused ATPase/permease subunit